MKTLCTLLLLTCSVVAKSQTNNCQNPLPELSSLEREALVAQAESRADDSLVLLSRASREKNASSSPLVQARIESELGDLFLSKRDWNKAFQHKKKAFDAFQAGGVLLEVRRTALSLATVLLERKQFNDASHYLDVARTVPVPSECLDDDDRAAMASLSSLENQFAGAWNSAISDSRAALEYWSRAHGANHPYTGWGHVLLADAYENAGRSVEALKEFQSAAAILRDSPPTSNGRYLAAVRGYNRALRETGEANAREDVQASLR